MQLDSDIRINMQILKRWLDEAVNMDMQLNKMHFMKSMTWMCLLLFLMLAMGRYERNLYSNRLT